MYKFAIGLSLLCASTISYADAISDAAASSARTSEQRLRDEYRHPQQTLRFFGIEPTMTVVEISPGGGWYSNILAPLLKPNGHLYAAHFYVDSESSPFYKTSRETYAQRIATDPIYSQVTLTAFDPVKALDIAPAGSADAVLTFRNLHNWYMKAGEDGLLNAFKAFNLALKTNGVLGIVEHRLNEDVSDDTQRTSGYMKASLVKRLAQQAGFKLIAESDVNANAMDTKDYPKGVWTLPPSLRLGPQPEYLAIGESDRMTLKFVKVSDAHPNR